MTVHLSKTLTDIRSIFVTRLLPIFPAIIFLIPFSVFAQTVHSSVALDSTDGTLGDVFHVRWQVDHPVGVEIQFPALENHIGTFEVLDQAKSDPNPGTSLDQFSVAVYDSVGPHDFPDQIGYVVSGTDTSKINLPGFRINIRSVLTGQDSTFRSIKPIHDIRTPFNWWILLWVALVVVGGYLIYRFWPHRQHREKLKKAKIIIIPPEEAHLVALRDLAILRESGYLERDEFKSYYSALTTIIRRYFEQRFLVDALEMTTTEVLQSLESGVLEPSELRKTKNILEKGDLVKFAKHIPEVIDAKSALTMAIEIVETTRLVPETTKTIPDKQPPIDVEDTDD